MIAGELALGVIYVALANYGMLGATTDPIMNGCKVFTYIESQGYT